MLSHLSKPSSAKMSETSTYHFLLVAVITSDLHTYTSKHLYLDPGLALITLGIALMAVAQMGYSPGIHTAITGGMRRNDCNNIHKKMTLILSLW
jgi:hypothetical protein